MSTHYTVTFDNVGYIKSIQSLFHNKTVWNIKHPVVNDTFMFIIVPGGSNYKSVRVFTKSGDTETDAKDLFNHPETAPSAYVPFGTILKVAYTGKSAKDFSFRPHANAPGATTSTDGNGGVTSPPDTGTIRVGG